MAVKNFAPELIQTFITASEREVLVKLPSKQKAVNLRFRFHKLRRDMEKEEHHLHSIAQRVQFRIKEEGGEVFLSCAPADEDFLDSLRDAGIKIEDDALAPPPEGLSVSSPATQEDADNVASAVADFMQDED
jgi:hypothetical protein